MYRGIIFTNAVEEKGIMKGIFISAIIFLCCMQLIFLVGLTPLDVVMQLITTFISGLFFAVSYRYTKNIRL